MSANLLSCKNDRMETAVSTQPNIIYILADDKSYYDISGLGQKHFDTPLKDALGMAALENSSLREYVDPDQIQIVFETCGWKMSGEPWAAGVSATTASIYLGVIQEAD